MCLRCAVFKQKAKAILLGVKTKTSFLNLNPIYFEFAPEVDVLNGEKNDQLNLKIGQLQTEVNTTNEVFFQSEFLIE
jgi:hypothetical protein